MTKEFILYVPSLNEVKAVRFNEEIVILKSVRRRRILFNEQWLLQYDFNEMADVHSSLFEHFWAARRIYDRYLMSI